VTTIPKRLIQTGKTRDLSPIEKAAVSNLRLLHPDWEYLFFDDTDIRKFIAAEFPQYQVVFDSFQRAIQRIDFFRYLAVYRFGGFYFDLDVFLSRSLDDLLNHSCVFPFEELTLSRYLRDEFRMDWEIGNYAFGATPNHPFLAAVIENCVRAQREPSWNDDMLNGIPRIFRPEFVVLNTTGPGLITRTLAAEPHTAKAVTVLFPENVCDERYWHQFGSYGVHLMAASWRNKGNRLWRRLAFFWEIRLRRKLLLQSQAQGPTRSHPRQ